MGIDLFELFAVCSCCFFFLNFESKKNCNINIVQYFFRIPVNFIWFLNHLNVVSNFFSMACFVSLHYCGWSLPCNPAFELWPKRRGKWSTEKKANKPHESKEKKMNKISKQTHLNQMKRTKKKRKLDSWSKTQLQSSLWPKNGGKSGERRKSRTGKRTNNKKP